ncbi:hypothetical protein [Caldalkalibacillus salinus]|uniref:hypothetical protein n=1 Tax=Caldalkalibacillus salinus TaxID=2803787 RepID=UPI0019229EF5|nr:hypothetical protein [Caldalkalibacillus salinus]
MKENEKPYSKLQWFFYIILIPFFFSTLLVAIIFTFLGYNVVDTAKQVVSNIPGFESVATDMTEQSEELEGTEGTRQPQLDEQPVTLEEITALESKMREKDEQISELNERIATLNAEQEEDRISREAREEKIQELARMYGRMSASRAAPIIENLTLLEAAQILNEMNTQEQTALMSRLNPSFAAQVTVVIKELHTVEDVDVAALQERLHMMVGLLDAEELGEDGDNLDQSPRISINQMVNTYSQLPPAQAAAILEDMSGNQAEFTVATRLLSAMSDEHRSAIMGAMETDVARQYTNALID